MPKISVTLTANAGVAVNLGGKLILSDALHDNNDAGFSTVPPYVADRIINGEEFKNPAAIIVTHAHGDHVSPELVKKELQRYPDARFFAPFPDLGRTMLKKEREIFDKDGLRLEFFKLTHAGIYKNDPNYGCLMEYSGVSLLILGDADQDKDAVAKFLQGREPDAAVLNFAWYALTKGRRIIDGVIRPKKLALFHFPFEAEDTEHHYIKTTQRAIDRFPPKMETRILKDPLQEEIFTF